MAALLDKIQPTYGTEIPPRASRSQAQRTRSKQEYEQTNAPRGTSFRQSVPPHTDEITRPNPYVYHPRKAQSMQQDAQFYKRAQSLLFTGISIGIVLLIACYTLIFLMVFGCIAAYDTWSYGPTHTAYTTATINGQASTVQTSNQGGSIYVTITNQQSGSSQTYTGPKLDAAAWGGDLNSIVATAEVGKGQPTPTITIHLIGTINYFRLFFIRPETTFTLHPVSQGGGYTLTQP